MVRTKAGGRGGGGVGSGERHRQAGRLRLSQHRQSAIVVCRSPSRDRQRPPLRPIDVMNAPRQLTLDLVRPLTPSLDNFVVGRNAEALAGLRALAQARGEPFVYLW